MTRTGFVALAVFVGVALLSGAAQARRVVYSIAIGNNQAPPGDTSLPLLRYADDDAVRYHELFRRAGEKAVLLTVLDRDSQRRHGAALRPRPPTLAELRGVLRVFRDSMNRDRARGDDPVLFLAFSGHGSVDAQQRYFLSFLDGGLTQEMLYSEVLDPLSNMEVHLIIDACNAGGVVGTRGPFNEESSAEVVELGEEQSRTAVRAHSLSRFPLAGALVATSSGQEAHEWSRIESGVFTHEVQAFVASANRTIPDPHAVPEIVARPPAAAPHAVLVDLRALEHTVLFTAGREDLGRFSITLPDGRRILDANVLGLPRLVLALPEQHGVYVRHGDVEAEVPPRRVVAFEELTFAKTRSSARGPIDRTLREQLFGGVFTRDYYQGFVDSHSMTSVDFQSSPAPLPPHDAGAAPRTASGSRVVSLSLLGLSGVALVTSVVTAVLAADAKRQFDETNLQRPAHDLRDQYNAYLTTAAVSAAVGAAAGVGAWLTWPVEPERSSGFGVVFHGRF